MRVFAGLVERPVLHGRRGRDPHGHVGQALLRHERRTPFRTATASSIVVEVPFAPIVRAIRRRDADRRDRRDPRHAPRQADPARARRAAGDQERPHGQPDARSAREGRRAARSLQPGRRVRALPGVSAALRVAARRQPGLLRWSGRHDRVADRTGRAPSAARSAHRRLPDPGSRTPVRARRFPRDRARAAREPAARQRGRALAR